MIYKKVIQLSYVVLALLVTSCGGSNTTESAEPELLSEEQLIEKAKGIHERVITLDTHDDINTDNFVEDKNYTMDLDNQVTLPKMNAGGLDVAWFIVYTGQDNLDEAGYEKAYANAIDKFLVIFDADHGDFFAGSANSSYIIRS